MGLAMATLTRTGLPRLLLGLERDGFSGRLSIQRGAVWRRFAWRSGSPVQLTSSRQEDSLCARLLDTAQIREADAARVQRAMQAHACPELAALLSLQLLGARELLLALAAQIEAGIADCVGWPAADAELEPDAVQAATAPRVPLDLAQAIAQGMARHWRPDEVLTELGEHANAYPTPGDALGGARSRIADPHLADRLLEQMDGRTGAWQLVDDRHTAAALWLLDVAGGLRWSSVQAGSERSAEDGLPATAIEIVVTDASHTNASRQVAGKAEGAADLRDAKAFALRQEILDLHGRRAEMTLYELLGVDSSATPGQVKKAYLKAAKRLHPDKVVQMGLAEIKGQANDLFAEITRAQTVLGDLEQRRSYDASLAGHTSLDAQQVAQAEPLFRKGEVMMKAGNFLAALEFLEAAVQRWPEEMDYQAALAWTLFRKNPPESARALEHFEEAQRLGNLSPQMLLRLSLVVREVGDKRRAALLSAQAKERDPQVRP